MLLIMAVVAALSFMLTIVLINAVEKSIATKVHRNLRSITRGAEYFLLNEQPEDPFSYMSGMVSYLCEKGYIDRCPEGADGSGPGDWRVVFSREYENGEIFYEIRTIHYWENESEKRACEKYINDPNVTIANTFIRYDRKIEKFW